jgi:7tm Odorant receptor
MAIFSVIFGATAIDSMYAGSIIVFCAHFRVLQRRFRNLTAEELRAVNRGELDDILTYHIRILELCETFKALYQPVILVQFLLSSLLLCVLGFQLTMVYNKLK